MSDNVLPGLLGDRTINVFKIHMNRRPSPGFRRTMIGLALAETRTQAEARTGVRHLTSPVPDAEIAKLFRCRLPLVRRVRQEMLQRT
jgi:hypothetical protein